MGKIKKQIRSQWLIVGILSVTIAVLNILRVIIGAFQTPKGYTYLAVGHFYQDYFEYTQQIAQGIFGHTCVHNQFTTGDPTCTLIGWGQYLIIGRLGSLFHLSPFSAYWISIFLFSIILCVLIFITISRILSTQSFFFKISAFLFAVFAVPFYKIAHSAGQWTITPYDFWYAPISLFHRIGGIPHHVLMTVCVLLSLLLSAHIFAHIQKDSIRTLCLKIGLLIVLIATLVTFGPLQAVNTLSGVGITGLILMWTSYTKEKNRGKGIKILLFLSTLFVMIVPFALLIRQSHQQGELFRWVMEWEMAQQSYPPISIVLLTIGPILLFVPFGIIPYFKQVSPIRLLVFFLTASSYFFAATPLAKFLGTFNLRFLTPLSYVLFASFAVLGIQTLVGKLPQKKIISACIIVVFLLYSTIGTLFILRSFGGVDPISYQPHELLEGIKTLNQYPDSRAILTSPAAALGMIVPCFVDRNVYLGRMFFTPNYEEKMGVSDALYKAQLTDAQAYKLLSENTIGYVLLSSSEPHAAENILRYPFLKEIYRNKALTIFQFQ